MRIKSVSVTEIDSIVVMSMITSLASNIRFLGMTTHFIRQDNIQL